MSRINLNIVATGNFSQVNSQIEHLRKTVAQLNAQAAGVGFSKSQLDNINRAVHSYDSMLHSTGAFSRQMVNVQDQTVRFGKELETGKLKLGQYFQIWTKGSSDARQQLKALAAQQIALEQSTIRTDPNKMGRAYVDTPRLMANAARGTKLAREEQRLFNLSLRQGGNELINWGKNTQWAGRQLMVGLTLPMVMFGQKAAMAFKEFDQQMTRMIKVYGDGINAATNTQLETIRGQVTSLAKDLAGRWGVAMKDTAAMASDLAATGLTGIKLLKATEEATRLATLGELDRQDAMKATIALQSTFGLNSKELAKSVDFLNAVENATSTSLQDLVEGIPRAGTVVKQLGGDYKELTVMMVAMREAGVSSGESANAIKSALGALINPTKKTREEFQKFNIDLRALRDQAGGDPVKMFSALGGELNKLDKITRARFIETLFGKYQFARVSALIENLGKKGSQTQKVFEMMGMSAGQFAASSQRELDRMALSPSGKFARAMEGFQAKLLPVGEKFLEMATKVMDAFGKVFDFLDKHPALQNFLMNMGTLVALAGPVIMLGGVFANFFGYLLKGFANIKNYGNGFKGFGQIITAESVAAAKAGDLFQASLINQSEAAGMLTAAIARLNAELLAYRGSTGGLPPIIPPGGTGGPRVGPSGPSGPVSPTTPSSLVVPGRTAPNTSELFVPGRTAPSTSELFVPGRPTAAPPAAVVTSRPVQATLGTTGPVNINIPESQMESWKPMVLTESGMGGGRRGGEIAHSTARSALVAAVHEAISSDTMTSLKVNAAGVAEGPLAETFDAKTERARKVRLKKVGGSTGITDADRAVAKKNLTDEMVTRGAWSAKGIMKDSASSEIQQAITAVPQNFTMPSQAAAMRAGVNLTPDMTQSIMMSQLGDWSAQNGSPKKVEEILAGKGKTKLSMPELESWIGEGSRTVVQSGRAFVDTVMADAEQAITTNRGQLDTNLHKLYNEATVAAGTGDWEETKRATESLRTHIVQGHGSVARSLSETAQNIEQQYDEVFDKEMRNPQNVGSMEERVRRAAVKASTHVDKMLDQQGLHIAERFAANETALDKVKKSLGIGSRYSSNQTGEVVTLAAARSVAAAEQVVQAERKVGESVRESINESNVAMDRAADLQNKAAIIVGSGTTGTPGSLIVPGRTTGKAPGSIIRPTPGQRRAGGGMMNYLAGGGEPINFLPGGNVYGPGGPREDLIPAMLSNGEYVIKADSVNKIGADNLRHINDTGTMPKYYMGGMPGYAMGGPIVQKYAFGDVVKSIFGNMNREERKLINNIFGVHGNSGLKTWKTFIGERGHRAEVKTGNDQKNRNAFGTAGTAGFFPPEPNQLAKQMYHLYDDAGRTLLARHNIDLDEYPLVKDVLKRRGEFATFDEAQEYKEFLKKIDGLPVLQQGRGIVNFDSNRRYESTTMSMLDRMTAGGRDKFNESMLASYKFSELKDGRSMEAVQPELDRIRTILNSKNPEDGMKDFYQEQRVKKAPPVPYAAYTYRSMGGPIYGAGGPVSDSIPAMLSNGEYVVSAKGHQKAGTGMLDAINSGKFNMGGYAYAKGGGVGAKRPANTGMVSSRYNHYAQASGFGDLTPDFRRGAIEDAQGRISDAQAKLATARGQVEALKQEQSKFGTLTPRYSRMLEDAESEQRLHTETIKYNRAKIAEHTAALGNDIKVTDKRGAAVQTDTQMLEEDAQENKRKRGRRGSRNPVGGVADTSEGELSQSTRQLAKDRLRAAQQIVLNTNSEIAMNEQRLAAARADYEAHMRSAETTKGDQRELHAARAAEADAIKVRARADLADARERNAAAQQVVNNRGKEDKEGKKGKGAGGMGAGGMKGMTAGMGLGMAGGMMMTSENKDIAGLGNVASMTGMAMMMGPQVGAVVAGLGLLKFGLDKYYDGIAASADEMTHFAQRFKALSDNEQNFLGITLKTYGNEKLKSLTGQTEEATSAIEQFAAAVKEAAVGTTEYARKQIFAEADTAKELFSNPAFEKLFNSIQLELKGQGLSQKDQQTKLNGILEGYLRSAGKEALIPSVKQMSDKRGQNSWEKNVIDVTKESAKSIAEFSSSTGVEKRGVDKFSEVTAAYEALTGGKSLKAGDTGQELGTVSALLKASGGTSSSDTLSLLVGQLLGEGRGGNQAIKIGGENLNLDDKASYKKAEALVNALLGPGWKDRLQATSGLAEGTGFGGTKITPRGSSPSTTSQLDLASIARENLNKQYFGKNDIGDADFANNLKTVQEQMDMLRGSTKELFNQFSISDTSLVIASLDDLTEAGGSSEDMINGVKDALDEDKEAIANFNEALAASERGFGTNDAAAVRFNSSLTESGRALASASGKSNEFVGGMTNVAIAAAAAALDLKGLGYDLNNLDNREITLVINRVIRTKQLQAEQKVRGASGTQSLVEAVRINREDATAPEDTGGGSSGGGGSGGASFDSGPYDKAIAGQQAIIEGINKEREARQKLLAVQKENDAFSKNEWALRKKISEAQGAGDFLGADLAQRELNVLQDQKAKDDLERKKQDAEDKRIAAAEKEIKRLQDKLDAANKANSGGGGGSSGGGGGSSKTDKGPKPLPLGVTAESIEGIARARIASGVVEGKMTLKELKEADKVLTEQYNFAKQLLGPERADEIFGEFVLSARENLTNGIPVISEAMATFTDTLLNDPIFSSLSEGEKGKYTTKILDIIGDPATDLKQKNKRLQDALKEMGVKPSTLKQIVDSFGSLGTGIQTAVDGIDKGKASEIMYEKFKSLVPDLPDYNSLNESQKTALGTVLTQVAAGAAPSPESIAALANKMIPFPAGNRSSGGLQATSSVTSDFTKVVTDLIGPASIAAKEASAAAPILMSAKATSLMVPQGIVTYDDKGGVSWTSTGADQNALPEATASPEGRAYGGYISGPGGPRDDLIPARLSDGEYVVQANAVDHYGAGFLDSINSRRYAMGGDVSGKKPSSRMMQVYEGIKNRKPGFTEAMVGSQGFAEGGRVGGGVTTTPNSLVGAVTKLAEQYADSTPYSSSMIEPGKGWGCMTSLMWLYKHGANVGLQTGGMSNDLLNSDTPDVGTNPSAGIAGDIVLYRNPTGVNLGIVGPSGANHAEMFLGGGRIFNGGVGIRSGVADYPIMGIKRPLGAGSVFGSLQTNSSYPTNRNSSYTIPKFHNGGAVGYGKGGDVMAMVQGGEVVVPMNTVDKVNPLLDALTSGKMGLGEITNNITINGANHSPQVIAKMVVGEIEKSMKRTVNIGRVR